MIIYNQRTVLVRVGKPRLHCWKTSVLVVSDAVFKMLSIFGLLSQKIVFLKIKLIWGYQNDIFVESTTLLMIGRDVSQCLIL